MGVLGSAPPVVSSSFVLLSEAVELYLHHKGKGRPIAFRRAAERACGYVIDACGDKRLDIYTKADANAFRDALISRGLAGSSLSRVFGTVRAVMNFAASEQGLSLINPFAGVYYDRTAGVSGRNSVPKEALAVIQRKCREADDDLRWLVAMVSDTGMRLAEAAGLTKDDIVREEGGSFVARVRPHPWRRLKTKGSERDVPLEGEARWAAERILEQSSSSLFAFSRYNNTDAVACGKPTQKADQQRIAYVTEASGSGAFHRFMRALDAANLQVRRRTRPALYRALA